MSGPLRALILASSLAAATLASSSALADQTDFPNPDPVADCQGVTSNGLQLRSGVWRNLHHLLYAEASSSLPSTAGRVPMLAEDLSVAFRPEERAAWHAALEIYAPLAQRDLLFDQDMVRIGRALSRSGETLAPADLPPDLRHALTSVRPIYERLYWERHRRINGDWCGALDPRLRQYAGLALNRLREIYRTEDPESVVIEVAVYANWAGAYTALDPAEIVIASGHPSNAGDAGLEIVIHEASHTIAGSLRRSLAEAIEAHSGPPGAAVAPRDLWHQILFYIAGEIVADLIPGYVTYADRNGLWSRVWPGNQALLEKHLRPVLDNETSLDGALKTLAEDLARRISLDDASRRGGQSANAG